MKILLVNKFFYPRGGTEYVFFDTVRLLEKNGHSTVFFSMRHPRNLPSRFEPYFVSHTDYENLSAGGKASSGLRLLYSFEARRKMDGLLAGERPEMAHLHNIYHQISPSILHSLRKHKVPVVMTLHDLKLVCPAYLLSRGGKQCADCAGKRYYQCVRHRCIKGSFPMSLLVAMEMYLHHALMNVYRLVDVFISPSLFLKQRVEEMGFSGRIVHVPNFIDIGQFTPCCTSEGKELVYFGRLSEEKGVGTLIRAMAWLPEFKLKIIGEGPLRQELERQTLNNPRIRFLGYKSGEELREEIRSALLAVFPSECLENNPRAIIEAFALGKPVVASNAGGIPELVNDQTGALFTPGDVRELSEAIKRLTATPGLIARLGAACRERAEKEFSAERHYERLLQVYEQARISQGRRS